ncbi:MAG: asparagine synthetase B, partial [Chloroflexi bacterium]
HWRLGKLGSKHLLRRVLYKYVPRALIERPKQGFSIPVGRWLQGEFGEEMRNRILDVCESAGLNPDMVRRELKRSGHDAYSTRIWLLYVYTSWHERWMA